MSPSPLPRRTHRGFLIFPELQGRFLNLENDFAVAFRQRDFAVAGDLVSKLVEMAPHDPISVFRRACVRALQGNREAVWPDLERAVELGLRDPAGLRGERDLALLHDDPRFAALLLKAEQLAGQPVAPWAPPAPVLNGIARVEEGNTAWDFRRGTFRAYFAFPAQVSGGQPIAIGHGEAGDLLRTWSAEGSAAGLAGDLYDNRDLGHSMMDFANFPQLSRLQYGEAATAHGLANGPQLRLCCNAVTIGNSSTAVTGGLYWRSLPRLALSSPGGAAQLFGQYAGNQIHVYPEHRDHDADFVGDVYFANTPYLITSQGSSGSDRPFLDALACTLAAFRPEVKRILADRGALMPTVQMIFRRGNRGPDDGPVDYFPASLRRHSSRRGWMFPRWSAWLMPWSRATAPGGPRARR